MTTISALRLLTAAGAMLWWCCGGGGGGGGGQALAVKARALPYRVTMTELELLEHVLRNEDDWRLVLKERVKGLGETPPHGDRFAVNLQDGTVLAADASDAVDDPKAAAQAADIKNRVYDPRTALVAVVPRFAAIGSMVSFAARVVHGAAACLAFRHLAFQAHYLTLLVADRTNPAQLLSDLTAFRMALVRVVDKLTLVQGGSAELDLALSAYWDAVALMQEDVVHRVRTQPFPQSAHVVTSALHDSFVAYVRDHCARPYALDRRLFDDARINVPDELVLDDVLGAAGRPVSLVSMARKHVAFVERTFFDLSPETLPRANWAQLFYHTRRLTPADPLDRINPFVAEQPIMVSGADGKEKKTDD